MLQLVVMVFIARHGQSEANLDDLFAGKELNSPLTNIGREQAKFSGAKVKLLNIAKIVSSPIERALETAQIIRDSAGLNEIKIEVEKDLEELAMGELSGTKRFKGVDEFWGAVGVEDPDKFRDRVARTLLKVDEEGRNILVVSHGVVIKAIITIENGLTAREIRTLHDIENAVVKEVDMDAIKKFLE
ncbi:MAG: 2,3-bisphosphoglycerate-dependent phosphoglycerate mutase [Patescibacteria group bacterium]|nr:2,3-bisphosphoglycerate-dependent phosphoglycerate mutase [Patescibacteria group bacterium]